MFVDPRTQLIDLINSYLYSKTIHMKSVMVNIKNKLEKGELISLKQYESIVKWIERDIKLNREQLLNHFSPVISELQPYEEPPSLEPFMTGESIYECNNQP